MRTDAKTQNKAKNSFIYFQLGLIAVMLTVLGILEHNFEVKPSKRIVIAEPAIEVAFPTTLNVIQKEIAATKTVKIIPKFENKFKKVVNTLPIEKPKDPVTEPVDNNSNVDKGKPEQPNQPENQNVIPVSKTENTTILNVEELPMFPECKGVPRNQQMECFEETLRKKVNKNTIYPEEDLNNAKQGVALITFVIDENGAITDVKAVDNKRATPEMQKSAENAVKKIKRLSPAKQGGKAVRIKYTVPIIFRTQ